MLDIERLTGKGRTSLLPHAAFKTNGNFKEMLMQQLHGRDVR